MSDYLVTGMKHIKQLADTAARSAVREWSSGSKADALDLLADARVLADNARGMQHAAAIRARNNGASWSEIAAELGVTRQAAQQQYGTALTNRAD